MMRRLITLLSTVGLMACVSLAEPPRAKIFQIVLTGAETADTNTLQRLRGYVDEIHVSATDGDATGAVSVVYIPLDGVTPNVTLATNTVTDAKVFRPRVDGTTTDGTANTEDPPERFSLAGETVQAFVRGSATQTTWTVTIKLGD